MIASLLIANRGEIARRIIRTARAMGVRTVAVHSDVDAKLPFVREADQAVCIGPAPARESYLRGDRIIEVALETKAEAIHPGYGFLSENADFAEAVIAAGLVWVGAPPAAIRAMGLKDAAKALMEQAGVPVTPGYLGADQSPERLRAEADAIGYPILIKAVAGGGGKGMRRVDASADFADALESCRREAASSFGDDRVLIEKYILSPRHIEVQVFGDTHGQVVHLFERDCSLQRRHQKVIEEAPAPGMDEATRAALCATAVTAARAVDYVGAGTIEFIADASEGLRADRIWFMEMNTRLQVEHPVTEAITGQDLVEWQLRVASGERLPRRQDELAIDGWAMEARLYAEDPAKGFLPSVGRLDRLRFPRNIRIDSGVDEGGAVTPFYDPMIAKLIVHAADRMQASSRLSDGCERVEVWPVRTNATFLARLLSDPAFGSGDIDTGFIARCLDDLLKEVPDDAVLAAGLSWRLEPFMDAEASHRSSPWAGNPSGLFGFRLNGAAATARLPVQLDGREIVVEVDVERSAEDWSWRITADGRTLEPGGPLPTTHGNDADATGVGDVLIFARGSAYQLFFGRRMDEANAGQGRNGAITAPMPGRVVSVDVTEGQAVTAGQTLVAIEAMKMEQALVAPFDGVVAAVTAVTGAQVSEGTVLARVERADQAVR